jgi:hypothetical protein
VLLLLYLQLLKLPLKFNRLGMIEYRAMLLLLLLLLLLMLMLLTWRSRIRIL